MGQLRSEQKGQPDEDTAREFAKVVAQDDSLC
jgi:hypothetical protein